MMKLNIRGDKIEVTESIKLYVEEKLSKLDKYFKEELEAKVLIRVRNNLQFIEVTIPTNKFTIRAEAGNQDLYAAIDKAEEVLERQIRKNKTKKEFRAHNDYIDIDDFIIFLEKIKHLNIDIDIMLECKQKDEALFKLVRQLKYHNYHFIDDTTIKLK